MRFLPVVERELRVAARKASTHRSRFLAALAASFIIGGMVFFFQSTRPPAELGRNTFGILSFLLTWACIIGGLMATFDTLSEEKRQGAIGLLFLTPLNNLDLILGKLAGATLTVAFGVIAVTPILAITLAVGGVTQGEIWRLLLSLLTILFFSSSAGLLVSSLHEDASKSFLYSIGFVIAWLAAVGFGDWILSVVLTQSISPIAFLNPTTLPRFSRDASFSIAPERFWQTLMCVSAAGSIFLVAATRITARARRSAFGGRRSSKPGSWFARLRSRLGVDSGRERTPATTERRRTLEQKPVVWLGTRGTDHPSLLRWAVILVMIVMVGASLATSLISSSYQVAPVIVIGFFVNLLLKFWVGVVACQSFNEMRKTGELELLLTMPLQPRQIVQGQIDSIQHIFERPLIWIVTAQVIPVALALFFLPDAAETFVWGIIVTLGVFISLLTDLRAIAWLGLWNGLAYSKMHVALGRTIFMVLVIPWLTFIVPCAGVVLMLGSPFHSLSLANKAESRFRDRFPRIVSDPGAFKNGKPVSAKDRERPSP